MRHQQSYSTFFFPKKLKWWSTIQCVEHGSMRGARCYAWSTVLCVEHDAICNHIQPGPHLSLQHQDFFSLMGYLFKFVFQNYPWENSMWHLRQVWCLCPTFARVHLPKSQEAQSSPHARRCSCCCLGLCSLRGGCWLAAEKAGGAGG